MCENSRINWAGIQESLQTKLDRFLHAHKVTPVALGTSLRELHMNRQSRLRFNVLRAKSLKQHYVKRKCKGKPRNAFGPTSALKQSRLYSSKRHIKQPGFYNRQGQSWVFQPLLFLHLQQRGRYLNIRLNILNFWLYFIKQLWVFYRWGIVLFENVNLHKKPWRHKLPSSIWKKCADEL